MSAVALGRANSPAPTSAARLSARVNLSGPDQLRGEHPQQIARGQDDRGAEVAGGLDEAGQLERDELGDEEQQQPGNCGLGSCWQLAEHDAVRPAGVVAGRGTTRTCRHGSPAPLIATSPASSRPAEQRPLRSPPPTNRSAALRNGGGWARSAGRRAFRRDGPHACLPGSISL